MVLQHMTTKCRCHGVCVWYKLSRCVCFVTVDGVAALDYQVSVSRCVYLVQSVTVCVCFVTVDGVAAHDHQVSVSRCVGFVRCEDVLESSGVVPRRG